MDIVRREVLMEDNIIDILFDAKEDDDLFNLNDELLVSLDNELENTNSDISKFIEKKHTS